MEQDCCFQTGRDWFRYRAAAIIVEDGCVLLAGNAREDYLYSVGGGVHMGERAEDAVCREVLEETGVAYEIDRLAVLHENFFDGANGLHCHELSFYFLMRPRGTQALHSNSLTSWGGKEEMHWVPIGELGTCKAFPTFLQDYLAHPTAGIVHIVTDERRKKESR
mgnify:CR=1 FL=1